MYITVKGSGQQELLTSQLFNWDFHFLFPFLMPWSLLPPNF